MQLSAGHLDMEDGRYNCVCFIIAHGNHAIKVYHSSRGTLKSHVCFMVITSKQQLP